MFDLFSFLLCIAPYSDLKVQAKHNLHLVSVCRIIVYSLKQTILNSERMYLPTPTADVIGYSCYLDYIVVSL